jgi:hypothetical protein
MHWIIKTAFLLFYLRFAKGIFRTLTYSVIGLNTTFTIIEWLIYCLQCVPLGAFFHKAEHPGVNCLSNTVQAFVPAAFVSLHRNPSVTFLLLTVDGTDNFH